MEKQNDKEKSSENSNESKQVVHIKKPKRIFHCSDGIYEEYSSDEEEEQKPQEPRSFPWRIARSLINVLDYSGETLGEFFNITTPKYSYEIEQFKKEQEERAKEEAFEKDNTWDVEKNDEERVPVTEGPSKNVEKF